MREYYQLLGLSADADMDDLKKAFRQRAKLFHPDINSSPCAESEFIRIHTAYEMIREYLNRKNQATFLDPVAEAEERRRRMEERAKNYARMQYEEFKRECEAYHNSPYSWLFKILYYGLFYLYMFCAMVFAFVPIWAGWEGGIFYFVICLPLYVLAYFTVGMANDWKREIDPLFN